MKTFLIIQLNIFLILGSHYYSMSSSSIEIDVAVYESLDLNNFYKKKKIGKSKGKKNKKSKKGFKKKSSLKKSQFKKPKIKKKKAKIAKTPQKGNAKKKPLVGKKKSKLSKKKMRVRLRDQKKISKYRKQKLRSKAGHLRSKFKKASFRKNQKYKGPTKLKKPLNVMHLNGKTQLRRVQFGHKANNRHHAFRHILRSGLNPNKVEQHILKDLAKRKNIKLSENKPSSTLKTKTKINGQSLSYGIHLRKDNGVLNIGKIYNSNITKNQKNRLREKLKREFNVTQPVKKL